MVGYFAGIDPGEYGGLGVINQSGQYVAAHRWARENPILSYNVLLLIKDMLKGIYLEDVRVFPRESKGLITTNQSLLINAGIWQGWLISLALPVVKVSPATWQACHGLRHYRKNPMGPTPLSLARQFWPGAPLEFNADDGKAVGLLLADLCRRDSLRGIDRAGLQAQAKEKERQAKRVKRALARSEFQW